MKKKMPIMIIVAIIAIIIVTVVVVTQSSNWSNLSYEAIVQEVLTMPDREIRLIVERTTEIYANPLNSLHIGVETKLIDTEGNIISTDDLQPGMKVKITLKNAFTEETPFYFPTVYEIHLIKN